MGTVGDLWNDVKVATWGTAVELMAGRAEEFSRVNRIPEVNAIAHTYVSAELVYYESTYIWHVDGAVQDAVILGNLKEWVPHLFGDDNPLDTIKDQWNNDVGRTIAAYGVKLGWPWAKVEATILGAYKSGWIARDESDPRLKAIYDNSNHDSLLLDALKAWGSSPLIAPMCFPASTPIATSLTSTTPISDLRVGDTVLAFDPHTDDGRESLVPRRVTRLFRNETREWVKLTWVEAGEARELVATPGHHFLDRHGNFPSIADMIRDGAATVVLASGELVEVQAERIVYSASTAHLFEQATAQMVAAGNTALAPHPIDAWATYNFEVEDLHTYVAGGVRVHNVSLFTPDAGSWGSLGDQISGHISSFAFGANTLESAVYGSALKTGVSTAFDAAQALYKGQNFDAADHLAGRGLYNLAGGLGAMGGNWLMQEAISGLGIKGPAVNDNVASQNRKAA